MPYHVYPRQDGAVVSHVEYDANLGFHGRLTAKPSPIGSTDSIADATEMAYAYLGRNPSGAVYIAGDDDLIYDVILNDGYHADQSKNEKLLCLSFSLLIFCFTAFVSSTFLGAGLGSFLSFIGVSLLYVAITRTGIQNEVEGGVVCFMILVLLLLLLPAFAAAIDAYKRKNTAGNQAMHPSREVGRFDIGESLGGDRVIGTVLKFEIRHADDGSDKRESSRCRKGPIEKCHNGSDAGITKDWIDIHSWGRSK